MSRREEYSVRLPSAIDWAVWMMIRNYLPFLSHLILTTFEGTET